MSLSPLVFYYPEVNMDVKCKSIKEVKEWIENTYLFVRKNMDFLASKMNVDKDVMWGFFQ